MTPYFRRINEVGSRFRGNRQTDRQTDRRNKITTVTLRRMHRWLIIKSVPLVDQKLFTYIWQMQLQVYRL